MNFLIEFSKTFNFCLHHIFGSGRFLIFFNRKTPVRLVKKNQCGDRINTGSQNNYFMKFFVKID